MGGWQDRVQTGEGGELEGVWPLIVSPLDYLTRTLAARRYARLAEEKLLT